MSKKGIGLIQFRENKTAIDDLRNKGYDKRRTYEHLKTSMTISYVQFTRIWNKEFGENQQKNTVNINTPKKRIVSTPKTTTIPQQETSSSRDIFREQPRVIHNPSMTEERKKRLF